MPCPAAWWGSATLSVMRRWPVGLGLWLLALAGVLSVAFGVLLVMNPGAGALSVILIIGAYALMFGLLLLMLAFKLRSVRSRLAPA